MEHFPHNLKRTLTIKNNRMQQLKPYRCFSNGGDVTTKATRPLSWNVKKLPDQKKDEEEEKPRMEENKNKRLLTGLQRECF